MTNKYGISMQQIQMQIQNKVILTYSIHSTIVHFAHEGKTIKRIQSN